MHRLPVSFALAITLALSPVVAAAQADPALPAKSPKIVYDPRTELDMGELRVESAIRAPLGAVLDERTGAGFPPLLQLKTDFDAELLDSVRALP